jgi:hypothetical protein
VLGTRREALVDEQEELLARLELENAPEEGEQPGNLFGCKF